MRFLPSCTANAVALKKHTFVLIVQSYVQLRVSCVCGMMQLHSVCPCLEQLHPSPKANADVSAAGCPLGRVKVGVSPAFQRAHSFNTCVPCRLCSTSPDFHLGTGPPPRRQAGTRQRIMIHAYHMKKIRQRSHCCIPTRRCSSQATTGRR